MKNIKIIDLNTNIYGFSCGKIKKLSDKKLLQIEESIYEQLNISIFCAIIDIDHECLVVSYIHPHYLTDKETETIVNILNTL
jgi:hypothetical protein